MPVDMYLKTDFILDIPENLKMLKSFIYIFQRGLLALPSDYSRAMREASVRRTATDTDSYAFPFLT